MQNKHDIAVVASATAMAVASAVVLVWKWAIGRPHDDDDEMYYSLFGPEASPVATPHAFYKILERLPAGSKVLDVGIGSGTYLEHEPVRRLLRERNLTIDGVDISAPNVAICEERIRKHGLEKCVTAKVIDARKVDAPGVYDAILFMESFPCMSKKLFVDILKGVQPLLKKTGTNYLYHNLADPDAVGRAAILAGKVLKPSAKLLIGVDFGRLTTRNEMIACLRDAMPTTKPSMEILLSAEPTSADIKFDNVKNSYYVFWGKIIAAGMKAMGPTMEQYLITIPRGV